MLMFSLSSFPSVLHHTPSTPSPRDSPADLVAFSRDYFTHLAEGPESTYTILQYVCDIGHSVSLIMSLIAMFSTALPPPSGLREFLDVYESRQRPSPDSQDG
jgi:hypothetical protein